MDSAQREAIAARVLSFSSADQTEALISSSDAALTRFTHEVSNQNVATVETGVSVRAIVDQRTGVARTNRVDEESLRETVDRAIAIAKLAPSDPILGALPAGGPTQTPSGAYDDATAGASAAVRATMCDAIFREAEASHCWSAGFASTESSGVTIANSSGVRASFDGSGAAVNVKMNAQDSTGFGEGYAVAVGGVDAAAAANTAAVKARNGASPRAVEPGAWTVIFEPSAFGELMMYLAEHFSAQSYEEGSSFVSDGLERRYFPDNVSLYDDYAHPLNPGMPFDYE